MKKMNERIDAINQRAIANEERINDIDASIQQMSSALNNLTKSIEKHSTNSERMSDTMETITYELHQHKSTFENGIAHILKKIGHLSNKRMYTDIDGNYRELDPSLNDDNNSMDTGHDQSQSQQSSNTSSSANTRARVSFEPSVHDGNNTDQSNADGAL